LVGGVPSDAAAQSYHFSAAAQGARAPLPAHRAPRDASRAREAWPETPGGPLVPIAKKF